MSAAERDAPDPRARVQAVETAVAVLDALAGAGEAQGLSALAARTGLAPAKLHRYLASLVATGMAEQRRGGLYELGPVAARVGLAAVSRLDVVNRAADALPALVAATGLTAMLSVWGTDGPTVVRWERAPRPLVTVLGVGSVLPVLESATGRAFAAALPARVVDAAVGRTREARAALARILVDVGRDGGIAGVDGSYVPGLRALAAPVLDASGAAGAVITLVSTDDALLHPDGDARRALVELTASLNAHVPTGVARSSR